MSIQKHTLFNHWLIVAMMFLALIIYVVVCHVFSHDLQATLPEQRREFIRTIFYIIAIIAFPLTNLIRHIQLRLNQTVPGNQSAKSRYLLTIIVSMTLVEAVGVLGFVMFMLGDDFNTLYIFVGLASLGLYLYRPKEEEYFQIVEALAEKRHDF